MHKAHVGSKYYKSLQQSYSKAKTKEQILKYFISQTDDHTFMKLRKEGIVVFIHKSKQTKKKETKEQFTMITNYTLTVPPKLPS